MFRLDGQQLQFLGLRSIAAELHWHATPPCGIQIPGGVARARGFIAKSQPTARDVARLTYVYSHKLGMYAQVALDRQGRRAPSQNCGTAWSIVVAISAPTIATRPEANSLTAFRSSYGGSSGDPPRGPGKQTWAPTAGACARPNIACARAGRPPRIPSEDPGSGRQQRGDRRDSKAGDERGPRPIPHAQHCCHGYYTSAV
jgi:hypothetical protein